MTDNVVDNIGDEMIDLNLSNKVVKKGKRWAVRSWVSGKLLKRTYATKAAAKRRAMTTYRRSKRKRPRKDNSFLLNT